jgi:hypothetical protein
MLRQERFSHPTSHAASARVRWRHWKMKYDPVYREKQENKRRRRPGGEQAAERAARFDRTVPGRASLAVLAYEL